MRFLYASYRPHVPDRVDGALFAAHTLLRLLQRRGHACMAVATIDDRRWARLQLYRAARALSGRRLLVLPDGRNGYRTYRGWEPELRSFLRRLFRRARPDLVLTQLEGCEEIAAECIGADVPVIAWVHDNEFTYFKGHASGNPRLLAVTATDFVSTAIADRLGYTAPVLYPPVDLSRCVAPAAGRDTITLINPVREKGVEVVLRVAKLLPHRRFLLVETWPLAAEARRGLDQARLALPNVTLRPASPDIRPVYARTKVLLAPSQWVEAFCTVVFEANANGIPAVASRIGGIPTTLGEGGILLRPDAPAEEWAKTVESLMSDAASYDRFSRLARANAARPEFDPERIVDRFLQLARDHVARARAASPTLSGP